MTQSSDLESVTAIAAAVRSGAVSARSMVERTLARNEQLALSINGFCAIDAEGALRQADDVDRRIAAGEAVGVLAGVPVGVKDLEDAIGMRTVCGDPARAEGPIAQRDSIEVARLRAADAIIVGKTNTPAYGFHAETDNLVFGPTRNPWAVSRTSGGSSGGSAAVVSAGIVPLCTGSDGGGSIRIPSAVCGISGFKPTHGVVPMGDPEAPTWGSFSSRGPMARTFAEIAVGLDVVKGRSNYDLLSFELPGSFVDACAGGSLQGVKVIWSPTLGVAKPDAAVLALCEQAINRMEQAGAIIEVVEEVFNERPILSWIARAAPGSLATASRDPMPWDGRFLPEALMTATYGDRVTTQQMIDGEAGAHRALVRLAELWERCDVLVTPGSATVPPRVREASPYGPGWAAEYTMPFNLTRAPASTVHCGFVEDDGDRLPISLQLAAPRGDDLRLFGISAACEELFGGVPTPPMNAFGK